MAVYYLVQAREVLTHEQATPQIVASLTNLGPVTTHFAIGLVKASVAEKPHDPNYRLLEKAGLIKIGKDQGWKTPVQLTDKGKKMLAGIKGVSQTKDKDGTDLYIVPLAERKLLAINKINMTGTGHANVEFSWQWETNEVGDLFDAGGPLVKSFNTWDRSTLIDHYGANFYHNEATRAVLAFNKGDKSWQIASEY
jgi:hypothetical protein